MMSRYSLSENQKILLDALRGGASLLVVFSHAVNIYLPDSPLNRVHLGGLAVFVFFILSGFLISFSLSGKVLQPDYSFKFFFADRFARIFVPFLPSLIFVAVADSYCLQALKSMPSTAEIALFSNVRHSHSWTHFFGNLLMLQDYPLFQVLRVAGVSSDALFVRPYGSGAPFWTVSIEWWLYIFFGTVVWVLLRPAVRRSRKAFVLAVAAIAVSCIPVAYHFAAGFDQCLSMIWACGAVFGWWLARAANLSTSPKWLFSLALGACACMAVRVVALKIDGGGSIIEFQFAIYLMAAIGSVFMLLRDVRDRPRWLAAPVKWLSEYSYSMYLTHNTVLVLCYVFLYSGVSKGWSSVIVSIILSNLLAIVFWWLFERHYRKFASYLKAHKV